MRPPGSATAAGPSAGFWLDPTGEGRFDRFLAEVDGQLEDPVWTGDRLAFLSDHEGWGNVYSVAADGSDLRRHSDHADRYARALSGDGTRLVHAAHGDLYLLDDLDDPDAGPRRLDVVLPGTRTGRRPVPVDVAEALGDVAVDRTGRAAAVEVRGTLRWLTSRDGPVRAVADEPGVRVRLPRVLPTPGEVPDHDRPLVLRVTDAPGDDALELGPADGSSAPRRLAAGRLGRVLDLAVSPDGHRAAVASHDGRVLLVDLAGDGPDGPDAPDGPDEQVEPVVLAEGLESDATGLVFSPCSGWLAWSHPGTHPLRQLRLAELAPDGGGPARVVEATPLRFVDTDPVFTDDGLHLAFLSVRTFDPVYDAMAFDMAFVAAQRPYLLPLAATTPSPLDPSVDGRPVVDPPAAADPGATPAAPAPTVVDVDGLLARAVPLPVPGGRYEDLQAAVHGLLWREPPLAGELGESRRAPDDEPKAALRRFDLRTRTVETLVEGVRGAWVSGDGTRVLVRGDDGLRLLPADRKVPADDTQSAVTVDLGRVRVVVDPATEWRQMFDEQGRLMRDHFWVPDMAGVDWDEVLRRYRPLVDRAATRDDLSEILWETVGELGSSHAYETPPPRPVEPRCGSGTSARTSPATPTARGGWPGCCPASPASSPPARRCWLPASGWARATPSSPSTAARSMPAPGPARCSSGPRPGPPSSQSCLPTAASHAGWSSCRWPTSGPSATTTGSPAGGARCTRRRTAGSATSTSRTWWPAAGRSCTATCTARSAARASSSTCAPTAAVTCRSSCWRSWPAGSAPRP